MENAIDGFCRFSVAHLRDSTVWQFAHAPKRTLAIEPPFCYSEVNLTRQEETMPQARMMTLDEKLDIAIESIRLKDAGKEAEANRVLHKMPLDPHLAQTAKKYFGVAYLLKSGWNLSEAESGFGSDWLTR